jgi:hypothetical protein
MFGQRFAWHHAMPPDQDGVPFTTPPNATPNVIVSARPSLGEHARHQARERARVRFRTAHMALLVQGLAIGVLGGVSLAWSMANMRFGTEGIPILFLLVTPMHGGLLLAGGALAVLACLGRWTTVGFSVLAAITWAGLTVVSGFEAARHAPGVLGFDPHDTLLYAVLAAYHVGLCLLLRPTLRELRRAS